MRKRMLLLVDVDEDALCSIEQAKNVGDALTSFFDGLGEDSGISLADFADVETQQFKDYEGEHILQELFGLDVTKENLNVEPVSETDTDKDTSGYTINSDDYVYSHNIYYNVDAESECANCPLYDGYKHSDVKSCTACVYSPSYLWRFMSSSYKFDKKFKGDAPKVSMYVPAQDVPKDDDIEPKCLRCHNYDMVFDDVVDPEECLKCTYCTPAQRTELTKREPKSKETTGTKTLYDSNKGGIIKGNAYTHSSYTYKPSPTIRIKE